MDDSSCFTDLQWVTLFMLLLKVKFFILTELLWSPIPVKYFAFSFHPWFTFYYQSRFQGSLGVHVSAVVSISANGTPSFQTTFFRLLTNSFEIKKTMPKWILQKRLKINRNCVIYRSALRRIHKMNIWLGSVKFPSNNQMKPMIL